MQNKKKTTFWVLVGVMAVIAVLGAGYSYLAFMPTGHGEFQPAAVAAQELVLKMAQPRSEKPEIIDTRIKPTTQTLVAKPVAAWVATHSPEVDFFAAVTDFNDVELFRQKLGIAAYHHVLFPILPHPVVITTNWIKPNEPQPGQPIWPTIEPDYRDHVIRYVPFVFNKRAMDAAEPEQISKFRARIDDIENFLTGAKWDVSQPKKFFAPDHYEVFARLALFAIARASLNHDQDRAAKLLVRFLEAERIIRMFDHDRADNDDDEIAVVLFGLAELPDFPASGWDRARAELERMRLSENELANLRSARAAEYHATMVGVLKKRGLGKRANTWHYFGGGRLESATDNVIEPIALRRLERLTMAMAADDYAEFERALGKFNSTLKYMNVSGFSREQAPEFYWAERRFNDKVDRALLLFEAARARREGKSIDTPIAIGSPPRQHLESIMLPRAGIFLQDQMKPEEQTRVASATLQFEMTHPGRGLVWEEDVKTVLKALGPGDWDKYVKWRDPHPAYVLWSLGHMENRFIYKHDPKIDPYRQTKAIKLQTLAIDSPLISDEVKKLLSPEPNTMQ